MRHHLFLGATSAALILGAGVFAHVRLQTSGAVPLFWPAPASVGIVINSTGSDDITDGSHETALRNAIDAWNDASGTTIQLVEDTSPVQQARTDYSASDTHLILFDETNSSGYFADPGTVAVTPVWFFSDGRIFDADVLYNGMHHQFTTEAAGGRFDVGDVGTHELGHLLGLDHSGWAGASMYPYVDPTVILHRSISLDDRNGMREAYPSGTHATIMGTVRRQSDNSIVAGAHVFVRDLAGYTSGGTITASDGTFSLRGLDAGFYEVCASPLDFPVSSANLSPGHVVQTDFESFERGVFDNVNAGETISVGDILVDADVALSLGRNSDNYPLRARTDGAAWFFTAGGSGLAVGSTLDVSDPSGNVTVNATAWAGSSVSFSVTTLPGTVPGHVDLKVTNLSGEVSVLPAALEITPPDPSITSVTPSAGLLSGGTPVTIDGDDFGPGARVVIGPRIYVDGEPGGCTVVDSNTITLTTAATAPSAHDVVVIDATGVEGRASGGFLFYQTPTVDTLFPTAGDAAGGTTVVIRGSNFLPGTTVVRIDGIAQPGAVVADDTRITLMTNAYAAGGPYTVDVENPGGQIASAAFTYVAQADPAISTLTPPAGSSAGGEQVVVTGSNFTATTEVVFGADADTGAGGTSAFSVNFVDANTLEVVTPTFAPGAQNVMVREAGTGQAEVSVAAFSFQGSSDGGGGGGCHTVPFSTPSGPWDVLSALLGWVVAFAVVFVRALRGRRRIATAS